MNVPEDIALLAESGFIGMQAHPEHHYDWRIRRKIYDLMQQQYNEVGTTAKTWLAIIAAEYVLPIFTETFHNDPLPKELVSYAILIARKEKKRKSPKVFRLLDEGYLSTGIDCMSWREFAAYNAEYAGEAAYKALIEAVEVKNLLGETDKLLRGEVVQASPLDKSMNPDDATDYHIAHLVSYSDTASSAAIAFSCEKEIYQLDPQRLKSFWHWWTTTAIPEAWNRVQE